MKKAHIEALLENNSRWAETFAADNPGIFDALAAQQNPAYLWITTTAAPSKPSSAKKTTA